MNILLLAFSPQNVFKWTLSRIVKALDYLINGLQNVLLQEIIQLFTTIPISICVVLHK